MTKFDQVLNELINNANPSNQVQQTQNQQTNTNPQQTNNPAQPVTNNNNQQKPLDIKALSQQLAKTTNPQEVEKILTPLLQIKK
jgi:hypothetical protein